MSNFTKLNMMKENTAGLNSKLRSLLKVLPGLLLMFAFTSSFAQTNIVADGLNNSTALFTISGGAYYTGNSAAGDRPATSPFASEGTHGYGINGSGTSTLTTTNNINTSGFTSISLSFKLAAFSIGSTGNGMDGTDVVTVAVSTDGGTSYTTYVTINGNANAFWAYSATGSATAAYPTPASTFAPASGGSRTTDGYSNVSITSLPATSTLKVRVTMTNNATAERWVMDDFKIVGTPATPTTTAISPSSATAGSGAFTLTVDGTNFISGLSNVTWNGASRTTTFVSSTQLTAAIPGTDITTAGTATVGVTTTGAGSVSNTQTFTIATAGSPSLAITGTPTNHGSSCVGTPTSTVTYTITNSGTAAAGINVASSDAQFVVSNLSSTSIAGSGGTATYDVTFTPSSAGAQSSTITVTSSTPGSNSPTSSLTGTGLVVVSGAVSSVAASAIVNTTATLNGNVTTLSTCPGTIEKGFVYSLTATNSNPLEGGAGVTKTSVGGLTTGAYSLNLTGLTPVTGYSFKAYIYDGVSYIYGAVETLTTLDVATQLAYSVAPPATGNVGSNLTSFTVQARRADNSVDAEYTGNITLSRTIVSGAGSITGTTTVAAVAGVASFSAVQFDAAGTYTITAASGALTTVTSSNIVISLTPVSIFANTITGTNPNTSNPYTTGQTVDANITVSGIGRGTGIASASANNRYTASGWNSVSLDADDYFEFTLTPAAGYVINFSSFVYTGQASGTGPVSFAFKSSVDAFGATIGSPTVSGATINLSGPAYQNIETAITFRFYGWGASAPAGTFSINDFTFSGNVLVAPTVTSFTPTTGYITSSVVITGTNFTGATAVTFGGVNAASYTVDNATQITAVVASGGATGNIVVTGATGTFGTSSTAFTFGGYGTAAAGDFSTGSTWIGGSAPTTNADVSILHDITLSADVSVGDVALTAGKISIGSHELTIVGAVTRTSGFLEGSNTSDLVIADNAGTLFFTPGGTSNYLRNFTLNSGASATLGNELNITAGASAGNEGLLTAAGTSILTTGGFLTLKSNQFGTAAIAGNTTSSSYISGNVTVERYLSTGNGTKAWRLLSSNTSGQTINNAWQEGQSAMATNTTGFGTMITGRINLFASEAAAQAAGFDKRTNGSSILYYNAVTDALVSLPATTVNIATYPGYFLYLRGDRSADFTGAVTTATTAPTLRSTGTLFTGSTVATVEPTVTNTNGFTLVGNPFASAIDMTVVMATRTGGISSTVQVWDPKISGTYGLGGYQTFTLTGSFYRVTPGGGSYPANNGSFSDYDNVESGAAFFLQNTGASGTVTIGEAAKVAGSRLTQRPSGTLNAGGLIKTTLFANTASGLQVADGNMVLFDDTYSNDVDTEDSRKNVNFGENFGISKAGKTLVVEQRPLPLSADTIQFTMNRLKTADYTLEILADNIPVSNRVAFLEDRYTNSFTTINLLGSTNYSFTVNADVLSANAERFRIVFREQAPLPVTFTSVKAAQAGSNIAVEWKVVNQVNIASYEVLKSTDGRNFTTAGTLTAVAGTENITYNWLDVQVSNGANYYRIKSVDRSGAIKYTEIVKVVIGRTTPAIAVSPNPVKGNLINLQFTSQPAGTYAVRLLNVAGQVLMNKKAQHNGGSASQSFDLPSALVNGVYQLEVILPDNSKQVQKLIIDPAN